MGLSVLALLTVFGLLQYRLWTGTGGRGDVVALNTQVERQRAENVALGQRNAAIREEVVVLKSADDAIEQRARDDLGLIKPDEIFYRIVDPEHRLDGATDRQADAVGVQQAP